MTRKTEKFIEGGVIGLGIGVVNTNSAEFKFLRKVVKEKSNEQSNKDVLRNKLLSAKLQLYNYVSDDRIDESRTSGQFLQLFLEAINIKNKDFANYVELEESNLSAILKGKRKINSEFAFKLGELFSIEPRIWMMVQLKNELEKVSKEKTNKKRKYKLTDLLKRAS